MHEMRGTGNSTEQREGKDTTAIKTRKSRSKPENNLTVVLNGIEPIIVTSKACVLNQSSGHVAAARCASSREKIRVKRCFYRRIGRGGKNMKM